VAHAAGEPGALVDKYYEGAKVGAHRRPVCQTVRRNTRWSRATAATNLDRPAAATVDEVRVTEIWRYPVKSLGGETLAAASVNERGIEGDRAWGLYDPDTGKVLTARREPRLLFLTARLVDGAPLITNMVGDRIEGDAALSSELGRPVEMRSASAGTVRFESPLDEDNETDWFDWESTAGTFHDGGSKISIVSRPSLGEWDARRFRLNLIVDEAGDDDLAGAIEIGSAELTVRKPIDRCIMVTRAQPGVERDLDVLKRVRRERDSKMGVGAVVTRAGTIAVGDAVSAA